MLQVLSEALLDTLKVLPFLLLIYILIELLEHKTSVFTNSKILRGGFAPLLGSAAGLVPLCGFSVMAAKLYDKKYISTGTLLAVFIATSDEAVIVLLSQFKLSLLYAVIPLLAIKFVLGVAVGYATNAVLRKEELASPPAVEEEYVCAHGHAHKSAVDTYFLNPLWHSLKLALYLFCVTFVFGVIIYFAGEENIAAALGANVYVQPLITAAVGLIPSCASSVILTTAYANGVIAFGSMVAGLIINSGMGFVVLFKNRKNIGRTLALAGALYVLSCAAGMAVNALAPLISL